MHGTWVTGGPWERFGLYNHYAVLRDDGLAMMMPAHCGELVPGSTEDLVAHLSTMREAGEPVAPLTLELDPTYRCASRDCGGSCFSAPYRRLAPTAALPPQVLQDLVADFAAHGGRILRLDGGGDPLLHPEVACGRLLDQAARSGLKSTILTSGDYLDRAHLPALAESRCYVRVSLNAGTDATRRAVHGNRIALATILTAISRLAGEHRSRGSGTPIGATFLLNEHNADEVLLGAVRARDAGVQHFAVRRVLGPPSMRPTWRPGQLDRLTEQLAQIVEMAGPEFRVAVPWRSLDEGDLDPRSGDVAASRCWQSTLKVVVEPDPDSGLARAQLCGRYRGTGIGQRMSLPPLFAAHAGKGWVRGWREARAAYGVSPMQLLATCSSCIDRGFIQLVDRLWNFTDGASRRFVVLHLAGNRNLSEEVLHAAVVRGRGGMSIPWQAYFGGHSPAQAASLWPPAVASSPA